MTTQERRTAARFSLDLEMELHAQGDVTAVRALDVSRHGLFIACESPPALNQVVLLTVNLRSGSFDTMATVVRHVGRQQLGQAGAGLKLFCVSADGKQRWDRFVAGLENPGLEFPTRSVHQGGACFLVQPNEPAPLLAFFTQYVLSNRILYVTPAVPLVGADVSFVLVHPRTHDESVHRATVVEWSPDQPHRMGVRFAPVDIHARQEFRRFLGDVSAQAPLPTDNLVSADRPASQYAFFAPPRSDGGEVIIGTLEEAEVDKQDLFDFSWTNTEAGDDE